MYRGVANVIMTMEKQNNNTERMKCYEKAIMSVHGRNLCADVRDRLCCACGNNIHDYSYYPAP